MYPSLRDRPDAASRGSRTGGAVSRNVLLLGLTSLFTDVSSEALTAVLPLYFVLELRMTPLQFGVLDGLYQGVTALVRVASGQLADLGRQYKRVALSGYGLSALCKLGLLAAGSTWSALAAVLLLDRLGKGIRTGPRDALIALSSEPARLGRAFGVHRALDALGALLGPLVAFGVLALAPGAYDAVFVVSFAVALVGLALIGLFVENRRAAAGGESPAPGERGRVRALLAQRRFRAVLFAAAGLGLATTSDALIYLLLQRRTAFDVSYFPLLFVGTAACYLLLAVPFGRLADRVGRHRLFLLGHLPILGVYALLLVPELPLSGTLACVALLGTYYAATDGVLGALASALLPEAQLTTGLALATTLAALARLLASSLFGALWTWQGPEVALLCFAAGLTLIGVGAAAALGVRSRSLPEAAR